MKIEIDFCEIFQNDISLEEEPLPETSQGNESLQTQLSTIPKSDKENVNKRFHVYMLRDCFENLMEKMHFVGPFMLSMTIHKYLKVMHCMLCHKEYVPSIGKIELKNIYIIFEM
jgi:hypothetical protein